MKSEEFEIYIKGAGGKFNQGFISKTQFNKWNELRNEFSFDLRIWDEFTKEYLEKDLYGKRIFLK